MEKKYGWICPLCGKALSPDTKACTCYKEKKEEIKIKPLGPLEVENPLKTLKWVKDWPTPYDELPKFEFYTTSGSSDPCQGCPNKGKGFCHCTLCGKTYY